MAKTIISVSAPTPKWATWVFRVVFILTTIILPTVLLDPAISGEMKVRMALYLKAADLAVWAMGRGLGVKKEDYEQ